MTSVPTTIDHAIHFNNEGARMMSEHCFTKAIPHLQQALNHIKLQLAVTEASDLLSGQIQFRVASEAQTASAHEKEPFIFTCPIVVSRQMDWAGELTESYGSLVMFSFVVLYNLAVAMHMSALATKKVEVARRRLSKSLVFYELAYTMMQDEQIHGITETMAIINNIAQVQLALGDTNKAHGCYEKLLSILIYVTDCRDQHSVHHFESFFHNVLPAVLPAAPVAEAA